MDAQNTKKPEKTNANNPNNSNKEIKVQNKAQENKQENKKEVRPNNADKPNDSQNNNNNNNTGNKEKRRFNNRNRRRNRNGGEKGANGERIEKKEPTEKLEKPEKSEKTEKGVQVEKKEDMRVRPPKQPNRPNRSKQQNRDNRENRERVAERSKITPENENINIAEAKADKTEKADDFEEFNAVASVRENIAGAEIEEGEEVEIVGVRYKPVGKIYFFDPCETKYEVNDKVIVEPSRGIELGYVVIKNRMVGWSKIVPPLKPILRRATEEDAAKVLNNKVLAREALGIAEERVKAHGLKLKLIEAEYTFDNSKLMYFFTAENRIDFRELVKDLASIFKVRIELRQIGIRDQTKIVGGLSICGRPFCCNSFLQNFEQVTIKMAKEQNISINSAKISGACGRLMCCLRYEHETYEALFKETPKPNTIVETPTGETGVIIEANVLSGICKVRINNKNKSDQVNVIKPYSKDELKQIGFVKGGEAHNNNNNKSDDTKK